MNRSRARSGKDPRPRPKLQEDGCPYGHTSTELPLADASRKEILVVGGFLKAESVFARAAALAGQGIHTLHIHDAVVELIACLDDERQ